MVAYCRDLKKGRGSSTRCRAKVMLVGKGTAGKTTLWRRLCSGHFQQDVGGATDGVEVSTMQRAGDGVELGTVQVVGLRGVLGCSY